MIDEKDGSFDPEAFARGLVKDIDPNDHEAMETVVKKYGGLFNWMCLVYSKWEEGGAPPVGDARDMMLFKKEN